MKILTKNDKKNKKRLFFCVFLCAFVFSFEAFCQSSNAELFEIEKKVKQKNIEQRQIAAQATEVAKDIKVVSGEMIKTARAIQKNEVKLSNMEEELEALKQNLKNAEDRFLEEDENLIKTIAALENLALKPTEALFVQPLSPVDIIRSAILLRESVPHLEESAINIRQELNNIELKKRKVEKQIKEISVRKNRMMQEHTRMKSLASKKKSLEKNLKIKSQKAKNEAKKLAKEAKSIKDLMAKIENERKIKEEKQKQERLRLAKIKEQKKLGASLSNSLPYDKKYNNLLDNSFELAKGNIALPAIGKLVKTFGQNISKGLSSKGISLKTRNMAQVTAPFDGNVMFAGPFGGYGNLIIIDHGGGYVTLLSGLEDVDCEVGQNILAGEPVGVMPKTYNAELYVEIRKNNKPLNPLQWMKKG